MAFIPVPNAGEFHLIFSYDGQICENVFHGVRDGGYDAPALTTALNNIIAWWLDQMRAHVAPTLILLRGEAFALDTEGSPAIVIEHSPLPAPGTKVTEQLPNNVTLSVKWTTPFRGRSFRGRTYHLGLCEDQVTNNLMHSDTLAVLDAAYGQLQIAMSGSGPGQLAVVSRFHNKAPRVAGIATPITGRILEPTIDSQRRRLPGRGT